MLTRLIFDAAKQTPNRLALIYNDESWSYGSFATAIATARGFFSRRGYTGDGYAVLALNNVRDQWVLSLALRSLGLTTVAVPSVAAVENLKLPDVRCVIESPRENWTGLGPVCRAMRTPLVSMALRGEQPLDLEERGSEPPQGGNVLRTSGTTGSYKMILLTPAQEAEMLRRKQTITGMTRETLVSASNFPLWGAAGHRWAGSAWLAGGAVLINTRAEHLALAHPGLTHAATIPQKVIAVLAAPTDAYPRNDALKLFVTAGTATQTQIEQAKARITPNVYNCLVGTELGLATCTRLVTAEDHRWHQVVPGRIIEIVDDADKPLPLGEVGRMRVNVAGGPTGYLGDEETTRAFFKDGFFYSGDLGMMRADGRVALQGRATDVINVQGHKISPVPLEDRLREALGIDGVCVFSMQNEAGEEELHVALETRAPISVERLLAELRSQRIAFSARKVHYLRMLPRNHMGKLMRPAIVAQVIATTRNRQGGADSEPDQSSST